MWECTAPTGAGPANAITDVSGVLVGHHQRVAEGWCTGTTVILTPAGAVGGVDVRGGAPGTRETDLLAPHNLVEQVHAVVLSGGSAYGLDAASGVMRWLERHGHGLKVGTEPPQLVPIVPAAVLFDLNTNAPGNRPDATFGEAACEAAASGAVAEGCVGAGTGAQAGPVKGGVGTASLVLDCGVVVGALLAVNARGHAVDPTTGLPYAAPFLLPGELELVPPSPEAVARAGERLAASQKMARLNTVIGVVATDADLTKAECRKVAEMAHDGLARAIRPAHTPYDGDTLFCLATGARSLASARVDEYAAASSRASMVGDVGEAAATAVARAVVRAIAAATSTPRAPCYRDAYDLA